MMSLSDIYGVLAIAGMLIVSSNPIDALICKGFKRFPQVVIENNSWVSRRTLDPYRFGWLECFHSRASRR